MKKKIQTPTIKGMFVMSHILSLKKSHGEGAVTEVEKKYGKAIRFRALEDVPVREEVIILELILSIIDPAITKERKSFEAGRLHFRNFVTTPFGRIILSQFRKSFKLLMLNSPSIAGHVFQGVHFSSLDLGLNAVQVRMENNDYPLDHFKGFFQEWMDFSGLHGVVEAKQVDESAYEYLMHWS